MMQDRPFPCTAVLGIFGDEMLDEVTPLHRVAMRRVERVELLLTDLFQAAHIVAHIAIRRCHNRG